MRNTKLSCHPQNLDSNSATLNWSPPPPDLFKINYDGVVFEEASRSGIGVVIRNNQGLVIASLTQKLPQAYQAIEIEPMAAIQALESGLEVGIDQAIVEGDSEIVVKNLVSNNLSLASFGLLIEDACTYAASFSKLSYSKTKREYNKVAHNLIKLVVFVWIENVPPYVYRIFNLIWLLCKV